MKIFYWGNNRKGYRQEGFLSFVNRNNYDLFFSKSYFFSKNKYISFLYNIINDLFNSIKLIRSTVVYIPPMEHTLLKMFFSKLFIKKIICDIYAPVFDMTVNDEKIYNKNSIMGNLYFYRDKFAIISSTVILFLNEAEKNYFCSTVNCSPSKHNIRIIPLVINKKSFAKKPYFSKRTKKIHLCWTGSYIALQGLDTILKAAKILTINNFDFKLSIIGPQSDKAEYYKSVVKKEKLSSNVKFINIWGDMEKWEKYIRDECDLSLGIFGDSEKAKSVVANKVIDAIIFKTPIITGKSKGLDLYFNQSNDIFTVENSPIKLAEKIIEITNMSYIEIEDCLENAYSIYEDNFSFKSYEKKMCKIFKELKFY